MSSSNLSAKNVASLGGSSWLSVLGAVDVMGSSAHLVASSGVDLGHHLHLDGVGHELLGVAAVTDGTGGARDDLALRRNSWYFVVVFL